MSGLSQYQNVFRVAKHDTTSNGSQSRATKRNRQTVSCLACRMRKLKCDRQHPCAGCTKRGDAASCNYTDVSRNGHDPTRLIGASKDSEAQLRLLKLEDMVTSLMQTTKDGLESRHEKTSTRSRTFDQSLNGLSIHGTPQPFETSLGGHLSVNDSETHYLGATHWEAILENIRDIQGVLGPDTDSSKETSPRAPNADPDVVFGTTPTLTLREVCDALPPRSVVDQILSGYFIGRQTQIPILHREKFLREYESFWTDPSSVSFLWISMLFSALNIGSQVARNDGQGAIDSSNDPAKPSFFTRAGQALVTGRYDKARPYSVEAVLLYAFSTYRRKEDRDTETWMLMGLGTRLAMKMGYHRDPHHLANISPFEGEMRRRTFMVVETFDLLLSFQAGLPPIIHEDEYDTEPPSNLFDTDFDENCKGLPPSRPPTDPTPMLYYCYKSRLAKMLRSVIRHALALKATSHEDTMKLDHKLREMHTDIPPSLRMRAFSSQFMDPAYVIMERLNIDQMYHRCLCVLHRKYLSHDRSNPEFDYSRKTCTDAALQILKYQADLHVACQPGGQFSNDRWMFSSLQLHDFLLAAMIICLDLYESHTKPAIASPQAVEAQITEYDALKLSHDIWALRRATSRDARRASDVLAVMLSKVPRPNIGFAPADTSQQIATVPRAIRDGRNTMGTPTDSSGSSSWNASGFDIPDQGLSMANDAPLDPNTVNPLDTIFNTSDNIDWGLIDQYLHNPNDIHDTPLLDWDLLDGLEAPPAT